MPGSQRGWVLNDAYNANPSSMRAALQAFLASPRQRACRLLVVGAMNELGTYSEAYHRELGAWLAERAGDFDALLFVGPDARRSLEGFGPGATPAAHADGADTADSALRGLLEGQDPNELEVFLKGSRGHRLEALLERIVPATGRQEPAPHGH